MARDASRGPQDREVLRGVREAQADGPRQGLDAALPLAEQLEQIEALGGGDDGPTDSSELLV